MDRQTELEALAATCIMLQDTDPQERESSHARVSWVTLDFIADTFRRGGVDPHAYNVGKLGKCVVCGELLDPEQGELFVGDDGEPYCNDHYPGRPETP